MTAQAGFKIGERIFPVPSGFRWVETVLIERLTGLKFSEFAERLDQMQNEQELPAEDREFDPLVVLGLIAAAVWQANQTWTRERVEKFINTLQIEAVEEIAGEDEEDPPAAGEEKASPSSLDSAPKSPESESEATPPSPGLPGSVTGST
ncbi:MAG: hypothetical protein WC683_19250 [bacterium]